MTTQGGRRAVLALGAAFAALAPLGARAQGPGAAPAPGLQLVTEFAHQVTGVAVARDGRVFVNFPRWTEDTAVSVAEVTRSGQLRPFPDEGWNAWRNARRDVVSPGDHWVCVQSVVADERGNLWVVDAGAPAMGPVVPGAAKLVRIDLANGTVAQVVRFGPEVALQASYLNDVRVSPDGRWAYLTDSGARGAIVVVDLATGVATRLLDGHPATQPEPGVVVTADGRALRRPDGRGIEFAADGIALSRDGRFLYWQAIKGRTLYRIATEALQQAAMQPDRGPPLAAEPWGENGVADGLHIGRESGRLYITAPEENALKVRDLSAAGTRPVMLVQDRRLRWPDSIAEAPDGSIYVTTSRIQDSAMFNPQAPAALPTQLWRLGSGKGLLFLK